MSLSFEISKELADYAGTLREWSAAECRPYAREADERHAPPANWAEILDTSPVPLGRGDKPEAAPVPEFEEGHWVSKAVITEAIAYGDIWVTPVVGGGIGLLVVEAMGTPEQIARWYDPILASGAPTGFALTEPGFGSDTSLVSTTATRDGDTWVLNGTKIFCSSGATADYVTVFATVDKSLGAKGISCFVVPKGTPGFVVAKPNESKLGIRSWLTSELLFDNCVIPLENRLGWSAEGEVAARRSGRSGALAALVHNRPSMAAMAIALAQASLDVTRDLLTEQRAGFAPQRWAMVETELENMGHALERGRRLIMRAQYLVDIGKDAGDTAAAAAAKGYAPHTCERVIRRCIQLLGPEGWSQELLLEKWYRDVKIMDIFEGSGQIQRIIAGRTLMGRLVG
ncbi:acyl-CoA dehydrogenase family protein [Streptomyces sp. NY05-11A]|uniref:acyl-CoA dehydrogenase family protein n=1 Tax=Streptomyces soliscabiei TaxID=588897 RepID=UPI0029A439EA|nr:acyl-CoA dehydrogenase family protein [Streptomyces sp. NY05-11A]MDX2675080.1 acyl-CoA dehydrogenase family protein [Streptomyces sp. NY05-11A]